MEAQERALLRAAFLADFGDRVRVARESLGLSQIALSELADMHRVTIGRIERGQHEVGVSVIPRLARALGVEPGDLVPPLPVLPTKRRH
jgi:transcriptional regulator with XRE-family HTH domain